jgi:hypothetical protein
MIFALCETLWQHNFTIAIVVKLLINGLCSEEFNEKCKIFKKDVESPDAGLRIARCTSWVKRWSEAMGFLQTLLQNK